MRRYVLISSKKIHRVNSIIKTPMAIPELGHKETQED